MPAVVSHYYLGERVAERFSADCIVKHREAFNLGCQGPDPMFYLSFDKRYKTLGTLMHKGKIKQLFANMCDYCKETGDAVAKAYLMGFICHYALDKHSHPYVEYKLVTHPKYMPMAETPRHFRLESGMDYAVTVDKYNQDPAVFEKRLLVSADKNTIKRISMMFTSAMVPLFDNEMDVKTCVKAFNRMYKLFKFLHDPKIKKHGFFKVLEKAAGMPLFITTFGTPIADSPDEDWCNKNRTPWGDEGRTDTFYDMIDAAEVSAIDMLNAVKAAIASGEELPEKYFDTDYGGVRLNG